MNLIDQAQGGDVVAPRICFVCEHHFDEHHRFVDTGHSLLMPDNPHALITNLHGVKYICEHCAVTAAGAVMGTDLRELANEMLTLQRKLDAQTEQLAAVAAMDENVVEQVRRILGQGVPEAKKPGPKPGRKRGGARLGTDRHGNPKAPVTSLAESEQLARDRQGAES